MHNTVETGLNRTGLDMAPASNEEMADFAHTAPTARSAAAAEPAGSQALAEARHAFAREADALGSVPLPMRLRGVATALADTLKGHQAAVLIDKLGERLAFERGGVRLYEALEVKARVAAHAPGGGPQVDPDALTRIRDDEESHFHLLAQCLVTLGADPTAVTPCADTAGVAAMGPMQVVTDPRTTLAQALNATLLMELGDGAGWELLAELAEEAGHSEMAQRFAVVLETEREHLERVRGWLRAAVLEEAH